MYDVYYPVNWLATKDEAPNNLNPGCFLNETMDNYGDVFIPLYSSTVSIASPTINYATNCDVTRRTLGELMREARKEG